MIVDRLEHASIYYGLGERFQKALQWMATVDPSTLASGEKVVIDGENIFATLFDTETLPPEQCVLEGHQNYADIQYVVSGIERVGYILESPVEIAEPYDNHKDIAFFRGNWDTVTIRAGSFYIVWPQDLHAPRIAYDSVSKVVRLVVKVKL